MLFNSYLFILLFLPVTLVGFFALARLDNRDIGLGWLVVASLFFYAWWNPIHVVLFLGSILVNYSLGLSITRHHGRRHGLLVLGLVLNLGLLAYFKYANFFMDNLDAITGASIALPPIVLPLAISFFTFQQIAYLVDAWKGETREHNFLHYCLFITFFPQLIAGPIVHHREMLPQFMARERFTPRASDLSVGLSIFFIGLFKKVILADHVSGYANAVFGAADAGASLHLIEAWVGALAYTFQLYFDFSGYSDMAIGLGRLFGIRLPLNFNSPYKSVNIVEFWRRWHMTLSRFLRDYLYIPLGGNRLGPRRRYVNLMTTMVLGGLWHGAGWTFVVWGALHGGYLMINHKWQALRVRLGHDPKRSPWYVQEAARVTTFLAVILAWVFFRATSFSGAGAVLRGMAGLSGVVLPPSMAGVIALPGVSFQADWIGLAGSPTALIWVVALAAAARFAPNTQQLLIDYRPAFESRVGEIRAWAGPLRWKPSFAWGVLIALVTFLSLDGMRQVSEFLYFQF